MTAVLVVIANRYDMAARRLVARWAAHNANLLTPDHLSLPGWRHYPGSIERSTLVAGGGVLEMGKVIGVLSCIPWVTERDVPSIAPSDRPYVASEISAFLLSWLAELSCPIINPPTAICLSGPGWRPERWVFEASALGIPVSHIARHSSLAIRNGVESNAISYEVSQQPGAMFFVTVVGNRCLGDVHEELAGQAIALAEAAGVVFLRVYFDGSTPGSRLVGADPWPSLDDEEVTDALQGYLCGKATMQPITANGARVD